MKSELDALPLFLLDDLLNNIPCTLSSEHATKGSPLNPGGQVQTALPPLVSHSALDPQGSTEHGSSLQLTNENARSCIKHIFKSIIISPRYTSCTYIGLW